MPPDPTRTVEPREAAMIYHLRTVRSSFNGFERLGQLASSTRDLKFDELILDMSEVKVFDAHMAAPLGGNPCPGGRCIQCSGHRRRSRWGGKKAPKKPLSHPISVRTTACRPSYRHALPPPAPPLRPGRVRELCRTMAWTQRDARDVQESKKGVQEEGLRNLPERRHPLRIGHRGLRLRTILFRERNASTSPSRMPASVSGRPSAATSRTTESVPSALCSGRSRRTTPRNGAVCPVASVSSFSRNSPA